MSSHFEAAFPTAAVALGVWSQHPDIGDLLLASFYLTCPILVPLPIPTPPQVTEGEYKRCVRTHTQQLVTKDSSSICYNTIVMTCLALPHPLPRPLGCWGTLRVARCWKMMTST